MNPASPADLQAMNANPTGQPKARGRLINPTPSLMRVSTHHTVHLAAYQKPLFSSREVTFSQSGPASFEFIGEDALGEDDDRDGWLPLHQSPCPGLIPITEVVFLQDMKLVSCSHRAPCTCMNKRGFALISPSPWHQSLDDLLNDPDARPIVYNQLKSGFHQLLQGLSRYYDDNRLHRWIKLQNIRARLILSQPPELQLALGVGVGIPKVKDFLISGENLEGNFPPEVITELRSSLIKQPDANVFEMVLPHPTHNVDLWYLGTAFKQLIMKLNYNYQKDPLLNTLYHFASAMTFHDWKRRASLPQMLKIFEPDGNPR